MAVLDILEFPDSRLRIKATPIEKVDDSIRKLANDMLETMYQAPGIGLAATQVNVHKRIVVIDVSEDKSQPYVLINPEFKVLTDKLDHMQEGCLSVPGFYEDVTRPERIKLTALNLDGEQFTMECEGLLAVCVQHEIDHLNGKLFVDYISPLKRNRIKKKLEKQHRFQTA
ncbi:peptide deformylase [Endozoicomonas sp. SM1973]|uniref:Peptide deformylase n=1 Tax=Spartinivicinus marinus TaxID=2994442 RepID=A0A853IBZ8_9GAMM|nr:peptide deformylase [Spartinivicinus marinus]MCX4026920.1 peptide deformylase [Spartinivicinus marinus]NYZ66735.1 peptide deformylase [Spartinivicinus marinus]